MDNSRVSDMEVRRERRFCFETWRCFPYTQAKFETKNDEEMKQ